SFWLSTVKNSRGMSPVFERLKSSMSQLWPSGTKPVPIAGYSAHCCPRLRRPEGVERGIASREVLQPFRIRLVPGSQLADDFSEGGNTVFGWQIYDFSLSASAEGVVGMFMGLRAVLMC